MKRYFVRSMVAFIFIVAGLVALAAWSLPWKTWLESQLVAQLEKQGFQSVRLRLARVGLAQLVVEDVSIGNERPLALGRLTIARPLAAFREGRLGEATLQGLVMEAHKTGAAWSFSGESAVPSSSEGAVPWLWPVDVVAIPFDRLNLKESLFRFASDDWRVELPLDVAYEVFATPTLTAKANDIFYKAANIEVSAKDVRMETTLDAGARQWKGAWQANGIRLQGSGVDVPLLQGSGPLMVRPEFLEIGGVLHNADKTYKISFRAKIWNATPENNELKIVQGEIPWNEGKLTMRDVTILWGRNAPHRLTLNLERVSASKLMQQMTGGKAMATGTISGSLPIIIGQNGEITVRTGLLRADTPGILSVESDIIPGDNEHVALLRDVLRDFHYSVLSLDVNGGQKAPTVIALNLEGKNPQTHKDRPVKINVRLTGDVLNLVKQNLLPFIDPEKFLELGTHANP